jgi:hypothetical protein
MIEHCSICGCLLNRNGEYATATVAGRSHATKHHYVASRFFPDIFPQCPWNAKGKTVVFCYECHEHLLHNPVLLPSDIAAFAELAKSRDLNEDAKPTDQAKIAGRIRLFHEVFQRGLQAIAEDAAVGKAT